MTTSETNCELKEVLASGHSELVSGIQDVHTNVKDCHEAKEEASKVAEQRRLATEAYREKRSQSNLSLIESLHKFMEGQDAKRKETMMAASSQPGTRGTYTSLLHLTNKIGYRLPRNYG
jgi:hypothetical protein